MGIILNPDSYPCPDHPAQDLTQQVNGAIDTTPIKIVRFGFRARRFGPGYTGEFARMPLEPIGSSLCARRFHYVTSALTHPDTR